MPNITLYGSFRTLAELDGLFILQDPPADNNGGSGGEAVIQPVAWNATAPLDQYDFSSFTVAADGVGQEHYSGRGASKITDNAAVVAWHARGIGGWWFDGTTEYQRLWDAQTQIGSSDLGVVTWTTPLPEIPNLPVLANSRQAAGKDVAVIELDRHVNVMQVDATTNNSKDAASFTRTPVGSDDLEAGDSGKAVLLFVGDQPILLCQVENGGTAGSGPNLSHFIDDVNAALGGDALTVATVVAGAPPVLKAPWCGPLLHPAGSPATTPLLLGP